MGRNIVKKKVVNKRPNPFSKPMTTTLSQSVPTDEPENREEIATVAPAVFTTTEIPAGLLKSIVLICIIIVSTGLIIFFTLKLWRVRPVRGPIHPVSTWILWYPQGTIYGTRSRSSLKRKRCSPSCWKLRWTLCDSIP